MVHIFAIYAYIMVFWIIATDLAAPIAANYPVALPVYITDILQSSFP